MNLIAFCLGAGYKPLSLTSLIVFPGRSGIHQPAAVSAPEINHPPGHKCPPGLLMLWGN